MQVFGFDLMAYSERLDHLMVDAELPYPLPKEHFRADVAVRNYREHLDAWALMDELGFDGIGFNEHHTPLWLDDLAQYHGGGGVSADQSYEAPHHGKRSADP